jgi:hypothetical protein
MLATLVRPVSPEASQSGRVVGGGVARVVADAELGHRGTTLSPTPVPTKTRCMGPW